MDLTGSLTPPAEKGKPAPKPLAVKGDSAIDYDERLLTVEKGRCGRRSAFIRGWTSSERWATGLKRAPCGRRCIGWW